ncbi:hypothetical protein [Paraburkholderia caribensis]|uniref:hypothetical protein n=1 Tax=Paraburkholderia caribensis TaxID=75105 RepID=UPI0018F46E4B|nr:hypothetical protein [Paraburkholderia caribensis]
MAALTGARSPATAAVHRAVRRSLSLAAVQPFNVYGDDRFSVSSCQRAQFNAEESLWHLVVAARIRDLTEMTLD